jgi:hypothetical protein
MSPPIARPIPRFIADTPQEGSAYGRWQELLIGEFETACEPFASEAGATLDPESAAWFPDRSWGGRVYVPVSARGAGDEGKGIEYFGFVSFSRDDDGEPLELEASAEFTDVLADDNPDWKIDLNDEVIGPWRAEASRGGEVTLVWGRPLVRGALAATAELDGEVIDQAAVEKGRFTLVAVDAVKGFGDDLFLEIKLWDRTLRELAAESLYD